MSTTDSEDPDTEIHVPSATIEVLSARYKTTSSERIEPAQIRDGYGADVKIEEGDEEVTEEDPRNDYEDCIFPFIDLETAGNAEEDWEIFNILCDVEKGTKSEGHIVSDLLYSGFSNVRE